MIFNNLYNSFIRIAFFISLLLFTNQCGIWDPADARKVPVNAKDRVAKILRKEEQLNFQSLEKVVARVILSLHHLTKCGEQLLKF